MLARPDADANTVAPILTQNDVRRGRPSAQTGGEVHIVGFDPWKSRTVPELSSLLPLVLEDEFWLLPCSGCERTGLFHTSVVKGCLFYSFFTPRNWQDPVLPSRMSVWN